MKVLWVTNIMPHFIAEMLGEKTIYNLGWLDYSAEKLMASGDIEMQFVFPASEVKAGFSKKKTGRTVCYTFPETFLLKRNDTVLSGIFTDVLKEAKPDIIHIYGTEYFHTVSMIKAAEKMGLLDFTVVSIQGLVSVYAEHYMAGLPPHIRRRYTLRDLLKRENLYKQKKNYEIRGKGEIQAIRLAKHVIGRTQWDKACTQQINSERAYHFCNETLRKPFYSGKWNPNKCVSHSIFVSQSSYSIKGLHQVIECLPMLVEKYPDAVVSVTGEDVFSKKWYRINSYHKYIKDRIKVLGLRDHVKFLGMLDENQMKQQYLKSNVFVMPSSIENSPNSLGEAMILGVPCIAADVGGISDLLTHGKEGFLYPFDEPYMLAYYIERIFEENETVSKMTEQAWQRAINTHHPEKNREQLEHIYHQLQRRKPSWQAAN